MSCNDVFAALRQVASTVSTHVFTFPGECELVGSSQASVKPDYEVRLYKGPGFPSGEMIPATAAGSVGASSAEPALTIETMAPLVADQDVLRHFLGTSVP